MPDIDDTPSDSDAADAAASSAEASSDAAGVAAANPVAAVVNQKKKKQLEDAAPVGAPFVMMGSNSPVGQLPFSQQIAMPQILQLTRGQGNI